jgi:hypothetical protein
VADDPAHAPGYAGSPSAATIRRGFRETLVESLPERPGPLPTASTLELRDEARTVLAALAAAPAMQQEGTLAMQARPAPQHDGTPA